MNAIFRPDRKSKEGRHMMFPSVSPIREKPRKLTVVIKRDEKEEKELEGEN